MVQQELDKHRSILDNFASNLSQNKRDAIRNEERMARLQRKLKETLQLIADEEQMWQDRFQACENMPTRTMKQQMARDTKKLHLRKDYESVGGRHAAMRKDREDLIRRKRKVINKSGGGDKIALKKQVEVSAREVSRLFVHSVTNCYQEGFLPL